MRRNEIVPPQPRQGGVWSVMLDPIRVHEQGGLRLDLGISNDQFNKTPHTFCILAPITKTNRDIPSPIPV
ncbi:MAG: type II toxin-antitoxin system PemK/MazF family toxin [Chloroflexota bacterium]|nr:type II toxin-antitoxin system PemK/MazF family toxin [Chloroflexota bacterium]